MADNIFDLLGESFSNRDVWGGRTADLPSETLNSLLDPRQYAAARANRLAGGLNDASSLGVTARNLMPRIQAGAQRVQAANPYQSRIADQSRNAQLALLGQIQAQSNGPSIAGMQGQRAMSQMGQSALGSGNARAAMLGTQGAGVGIAGDVGQGRLGEIMRSRAAFGGAASNLRGNDIRSAEQAMMAQLQAQRQADINSRFYAGQGTALSDAERNAWLEQYKLGRRLRQQGEQKAAQTGNDVLQTVGTVASMA